MPHPCVVCGRSRMNPNNREEEYMFFGFPVNYDERCKKWMEFCCREDLYKLTRKQLLQRMVCSKHFDRSDFLNDYLDRLNPTAVPSIYDPKQSLYNITCVLCGRSRKDPPGSDYDGTTFHHFPGEEFRCLKWLDFVAVDSYYRLTRKEILYCYICSNHFDSSQFMPGYKNRLKDNAVPNIRNPDQLTDEDRYEIEFAAEQKACASPEKPKKLEPLPTAVLESQACAACGRSRADPRNKVEKYKFHPFPAYEIGRCLRWCQFLGREDLLKMSPNQIRKLVLCSRHFPATQSFQKAGPCDAVPTIKEVEDTPPETILSDQLPMEFEELEPPQELLQKTEKSPEARPLVSSKKPFVLNKPTPLAKKRGKQKRSTCINIPKPLNEIHVLSKLPLPPTSNHWRFQLPNQFQPITIANTLPPMTNAISTDGEKVILPFTGNISNLGQPIPVSSLSSIPPGLLIKINLPQQEKSAPKRGRPPRKRTEQKSEGKKRNSRQRRNDRVSENIETPQNVLDSQEHSEVDDFTNLLKISNNLEDDKDGILPVLMEEHSVIEALDEDIEESYEMEALDYELLEKEETEVICEPKAELNEELVESVDNTVRKKKKKKKLKKRMSARSRRTLIPIRSEVARFLKKLKPYMKRLPKRARAQLKLGIVTMVIDQL